MPRGRRDSRLRRHAGLVACVRRATQTGARSGAARGRREFAPLCLTTAHYDDLLAAAETHVVIAHLPNVIRDELRRIPMKNLYPFIDVQLAAARQHGLNNLDEQTQYLLLALYTSGGFITHPVVIERLKRPASEHGELFTDWTGRVPLEARAPDARFGRLPERPIESIRKIFNWTGHWRWGALADNC